jgi:hypothetical protein
MTLQLQCYAGRDHRRRTYGTTITAVFPLLVRDGCIEIHSFRHAAEAEDARGTAEINSCNRSFEVYSPPLLSQEPRGREKKEKDGEKNRQLHGGHNAELHSVPRKSEISWFQFRRNLEPSVQSLTVPDYSWTLLRPVCILQSLAKHESKF